MTTIDHQACRTAVLDDEVGADVEQHLAACEDCRAFAADVGRIVSAAPTLYAVPDGLADRALARVAAPAPLPKKSLWADVRRPLITSTAIAAALLLVLGLVAVVRQGDSTTDEERVLLAAATAAEEAGSAEVQLEGSVEVTTAAPANGDAQFEGRGLPPEMEAYFEARWDAMWAEFERALAEFERRTNEMMDQFNRTMEEFFRRLEPGFSGGSGRPSGPPTTPPPPPSPEERERQRPKPPTELSLRLGISGRGAVSFDGDGELGIDGSVATAGGNLAPAAAASAGFHLAVQGDEVGLRGPDGSWRRLPMTAGPIGAVVLRPNAVPQLLRDAKDVQFTGNVDLNGEPVRHYRFRAQGYDAEAWIGTDGRARRVAVSTKGDTWTTTLALSLGNYGADVAVDAPPPANEAGAPDDAGLILYPFGAPVSAALSSR